MIDRKVLIFGGRGMLGERVAWSARKAGCTVWRPGSESDITNRRQLEMARDSIQPDIVVNCAGIVPSKFPFNSEARIVATNAYAPWLLQDVFNGIGAKLIHVSTDCVFNSQLRRRHKVDDPTCGTDLYGRTKAMGEPNACVVLRTSFIGFRHGLLRWLLDLPPGSTVQGYKRAYWSGATVFDVADAVVQAFDMEPGIQHLAGIPMSKAELIQMLNQIFDLKLNIVEVDTPYINRALEPTIYLERRLDHLLSLEYADQRSVASRT